MVSHGLVGRQRCWIVGGIAGGRVRREAGNDHLCRGIDVDRLAMHAARHEGPVFVVCDPPHSTITPAFQGRIPALFEGFLVAAAADAVDRLLRYEALAAGHAVVKQKLADTREPLVEEQRGDGLRLIVPQKISSGVGPAALVDIDKRGSGSSIKLHERLNNFPLRLGDVRTAATQCISGS